MGKSGWRRRFFRVVSHVHIPQKNCVRTLLCDALTRRTVGHPELSAPSAGRANKEVSNAFVRLAL